MVLGHPISPWLRRLTVMTAGATLFLVFAGAMVTSTGSGLAVPDWPLSYGRFFPPMVGGIFYEHGHRMVAGTVLLLTLLQAILLQRSGAASLPKRLAWTAVALGLGQALLGGLTVLLLLPKAISIAHAALAEIFLCINIATAFFVSNWSAGPKAGSISSGLRRSMTATAVLIYLQIFIGAVMRHFGAGLAIPDFPLSFGRLVPAFTTFGIAINFAHRIGALLVSVAILVTLVLAVGSRLRALRAVVVTLSLLIPMQIAFGAATIWTGKRPLITSLHVVMGASMLALALVGSLTAYSYELRKEEPVAYQEEVTA